MGSGRGAPEDHESPNAGLFEPWQCAFERDHVPPLEPEAERMFLRAREIQRRPYPSGVEREEAFNLYKQAAQRGHWRAMTNLAACYAEGYGTPHSITSADDVYNEMMKRGIPMGFYGKHLLTAQGRGVPQDNAEAMRLLHKAANLGSPQAQYKLGEYYLFKEFRQRQGLAYHICALRQGYADSARIVGNYLILMDKNYIMATEYYLREAALGREGALLTLKAAFAPENQSSSPRTTLGFAGNKELSEMFDSLLEKREKDETLKFPELLKLKLPPNTQMTREQSRSMDSSLRLPDGRWPDEVFPEFDPDYVQPRY
jgi:TPR repeat protein